MSRTVLVIGGAGYIGSHVCKRLATDGWTPVTYDNLSTGHRWAVKWGPLEEGDLNDRQRLDEVLVQTRPAAIMHFAALSLVGESVNDPARYYRNNVMGSLTLLEAMRDADISPIVFSSTCAVYGEPESDVLDEDHPCDPVTPYGATKLAIERMLADFSHAHALRYSILRYFNAAGAEPEAETGEAHDPETHLIPIVLQVASGQREEVVVHGDDYATEDGTCIRDYVDVSDLAVAHVRALERLLADGSSFTLNLGTGRGHSVMEIIEAAREVTKKEIPAKIGSRRSGDPASLVASGSRAKRVLEWTPKVVSVHEMIRTAWRWEQRRKAGSSSVTLENGSP